MQFIKTHNLLVLVPVTYLLMYYAFQDTDIFWYMYTFAMLVLMAMAYLYGTVHDELSTWKALIYGFGYGTLIYGIIAAGYAAMEALPISGERSVASFLSNYAPYSIWHYLLLMFFIAPAEELFWRGVVQQKLKAYLPVPLAVAAASALFGGALALSGFWPGLFAGIAAGLVLGSLYEWKKSMPAIIIAHLVMTILLFLVLPLPV